MEEQGCHRGQRQIKEINTGVLAAPRADLKDYLPQVDNNNQQGEYYLPEIISLAVEPGQKPSLPVQAAFGTGDSRGE